MASTEGQSLLPPYLPPPYTMPDEIPSLPASPETAFEVICLICGAPPSSYSGLASIPQISDSDSFPPQRHNGIGEDKEVIKDEDSICHIYKGLMWTRVGSL